MKREARNWNLEFDSSFEFPHIQLNATKTTALPDSPAGRYDQHRQIKLILGVFILDCSGALRMRMLVTAKCPHEPFNTLVRKGTAGEIIGKILADIKPEAVYFTEFGGHRTAVMIVDLPDAARIPSIAEPWVLNFHADCEFHPVMSVEDLQRAGLAEMGKKWG
jgi:hypothetical protein